MLGPSNWRKCMPKRINRAIELLEADQAIYYDGPHTGHVLTYEQGQGCATLADYINVGMEHGAFDMTAEHTCAGWSRPLTTWGTARPLSSSRRRSTRGRPQRRLHARQFRQPRLRRPRHPLPVPSRRCRGVGARLPLPAPQGRHRQDRRRHTRPRFEPTAAPVWGIDQQEISSAASPAAQFGGRAAAVVIESPPGANCEASWQCPDWPC